ncbi:hypothetical protein [Lactobacillus sp. PV034]|nr:hypothetical protein [Lactobacillus sp. PV034]
MKQALHNFLKLFATDKPHCVLLRFNQHLQDFDDGETKSLSSQKNKKDK